MEVLKDTESTAKYGDKGKNGVVIVKLREFSASLQYDTPSGNAPVPFVRINNPNPNQNVLIILREAWGEEKEISKAEFDKLSPSRINSIQMLKDEAAYKKYGNKAANGVIVVNLKVPMEMDEIVVGILSGNRRNEIGSSSFSSR